MAKCETRSPFKDFELRFLGYLEAMRAPDDVLLGAEILNKKACQLASL
jgi:hypothetical protein